MTTKARGLAWMDGLASNDLANKLDRPGVRRFFSFVEEMPSGALYLMPNRQDFAKDPKDSRVS